MDVRMGSEDGLVVGSPEQMCGQFHSELMMQLPVWRERLSQQLGSFRELEEQIRLFYGRGGAMLAAGLLAESSRLPATQEAVAKLQEQAAVPLRPPERRSRRIQLWGGLIFWITTLYCGPRERTGQGRGKQGAGLYAELAAFAHQSVKNRREALDLTVIRQLGGSATLLSVSISTLTNSSTSSFMSLRVCCTRRMISLENPSASISRVTSKSR